MTPTPSRRPRPALFLLSALVSAGLFWGFYSFFVVSLLGQQVDEAALRGAGNWPTGLRAPALEVLRVVPYVALVVTAVLALVIMIVRRRVLSGLIAALVAVLANVSTQLLKLLLDRPALGVSQIDLNSLPSGHTTAAASAAAAIFLVSSPRARPFVAFVGALFTALTGILTLHNQWHRPSDVIAAIIVVVFWVCIGGYVLAKAEHMTWRGPAPKAGALAWIAAILSVVAVLALMFVVSATLVEQTHLLVSYLGGAVYITAVSFLVAALGVTAFRRLG